MTEKQKRRPGYPITINKNVDQVREKVHSICEKHGLSASALFEAIVDSLDDDEWEKYALIAQKRKKKISISLNQLNSDQRDRLTQVMQEAGISFD